HAGVGPVAPGAAARATGAAPRAPTSLRRLAVVPDRPARPTPDAGAAVRPAVATPRQPGARRATGQPDRIGPDRGLGAARRGTGPDRATTASPTTLRRAADPAPDGRGRPAMADRFAAALAGRRPDPVQPLPPAYGSLARAIAGDRARVRTASGPASRTALAAAGTTAATVGDVVHLPRRLPARPSPTDLATLAHELVHVGRPAATPRMHGDDRRSAEESAAHHMERTVGALARRTGAAAAPASTPGRPVGTAGLAVGGAGGFVGALAGAAPGAAAPLAAAVDHALGRTAATTAGAGPSPSRRRAGAPSSGAPSGVIRRALASTPTTSTSTSTSSSTTSTSTTSGLATPATGTTGAPDVRTSRSPEAAELEERIVESVRRRLLADLERRGMANPGVLW
ncbi:MAG: DUF4157 domain-containing protein, partial [Acidimicrobiia bacterium]